MSNKINLSFRSSLLLIWAGLLYLVFAPESFSQVFVEDEVITVHIDKIEIQGNKKTKSDVILRELEFKAGDIVARDDLELARKRIENLKLFNRVVFNLKGRGELKDLLIIVWERWYIYPAIIFNVNEHDWGKLSYGLGALHSNFRGRAESLWLSGWLGYNPGMDFSYTNPWFAGQHRLYTTISLQAQRIKCKTLLFPDQFEQYRSISLLFGKKHGIYLYTDLELRLNFIRADEKIRWQTRQNRDRIFIPTFKIQYDNRDLWEYPRSGSRIILALSRAILLNEPAHYNKVSLDWREFRTVLGVTLAGRVFGEVTQNPLPVYDHAFIGYEEKIRGHFSSVFEGENRLLSSFELRVPLLKERYFQLPPDEYSMSYLQQLKFGIYLTLFRDAGAVWYQTEKLQAKHWASGYGLGLNFILPYSNIFRLEYALDEAGKAEWIADVNVIF